MTGRSARPRLIAFPIYTNSRSIFLYPYPLCDIPSGCCSFTGPWTVTRSSLRMVCRVAAFCRPLRPVLLLVSPPHTHTTWRRPRAQPTEDRRRALQTCTHIYTISLHFSLFFPNYR